MDLRTAWKTDVQIVECPTCQWKFVQPNTNQMTCPNCGTAGLNPIVNASEDLIIEPEKMVPFSVDEDTRNRGVSWLALSVPYPPDDLTEANLLQRLRPVYLPIWLIDADVSGEWTGKFAYQYNVKSVKSAFRQGVGWASREEIEQKYDWKPRAGRLKRRYDNMPIPALQDHQTLMPDASDYYDGNSNAYSVELLGETLVRVPDVMPADSGWEAKQVVEARALEDCRKAVEANEGKDFQWNPQKTDLNWTVLLVPMYLTYYTADDGKRYNIHVSGHHRHADGVLIASESKAREEMMRRVTIAAGVIIAAVIALIVLLNFPLFVVVVIAIIAGVAAYSWASQPMREVQAFNSSRQSAEVAWGLGSLASQAAGDLFKDHSPLQTGFSELDRRR